MVKETRHIFDLSDVKALRLRCECCGREAVQSIQKTEVKKRCPFCNQDWENEMPGATRGTNYNLVRNIQILLKTDTPRMTVRFEIDGEDS